MEEEKVTPLIERLRAKLKEFDELYRDKCNLIAVLDEKIRSDTKAITELPLKRSQLSFQLATIRKEMLELDRKILEKQEQVDVLSKKEQDELGSNTFRKTILMSVCVPDESNVVEDGLDMRCAELRRKKWLLEEECAQKENLKLNQVMKMHEMEKEFEEEAQNALNTKMKQTLIEKVEQRKELETSRTQAFSFLKECQRLVADLEETITLQSYAKSNGLVLKDNSTDELVRVCKTHQEKIALKNAKVDAPLLHTHAPSLTHVPSLTLSPNTSLHDSFSSDGEDGEKNDNESCSCSQCRPLAPASSAKHVVTMTRFGGLYDYKSVLEQKQKQSRQQNGKSDGWVW